MTPHYPAIWAALQRANRFEKYAAESSEASVDLATTCYEVFGEFLEKAATEYQSDGTPGGDALRAASFAEDLRNTGARIGEKVAAEEATDDILEKLAAVVYTDSLLESASEKLSGVAKDEAYQLRMLGREYGVSLLRNLVG